MFDFGNLRKTVTSLSAQVKKVRGEISELQAMRASIEGAPPSRADFLRFLDQQLDQQSERYLQRLSESFEFFRRHPRRLADPAMTAQHMTIASPARSPKDVDIYRGLDGLLAALVPSIRTELHKRIEQMPWPEDARPLEGREVSVAAIDQRLEALLQQEAELVSTAASCGIVIERRGE